MTDLFIAAESHFGQFSDMVLGRLLAGLGWLLVQPPGPVRVFPTDSH